MLSFSTWANRLHLLALGISGIAVVMGIAACPLQSIALQRGFVLLSAATILVLFVSFAMHNSQPTLSPHFWKRSLYLFPFLLLWVVLLLWPIPRVREAGARTQMTNNAKQVGLSLFAYHDENKHLPTDSHDEKGKPLLSWRVPVLPYLDATPLYQQFDPAQAWDGPTNRPLLDKMPYVYSSVLFQEQAGHTPWQGFVGPGTAFEPGSRLRLKEEDFPDGTSHTILFVEAKEQVPWSKPADIKYGPAIPLPPLGENYLRPGDWPLCCPMPNPGFFVCMADGTVRFFSADISEAKLRALIVRNDGKGQIDDD